MLVQHNHMQSLANRSHLVNFGAIIQLRQTCRYFHSLASPLQIRLLFGPIRFLSEMQSHCRTCLRHDPSRANLLLTAMPSMARLTSSFPNS
jgi:hypothetical protein